MASTIDLLANRAGLGMHLLAGPADERQIRDVVAVERLAAVRTARRGSLVVVIRSAAVTAPGYELDVAIRHASDHRLAALVLIGRDELPVTSASLANRAGLPVFSVNDGVEVADLVLRIDRLIRGGAADTLARAEAALEVVAAGDESTSVDQLVAAVSLPLSVTLEYLADEVRDGSVGDPGAVTVRGNVIGSVRLAAAGDRPDAPDRPGAQHAGSRARPDGATSLVLPAVAAAVGRILDRESSRRYAPARSRAELLAQLLVAERAQLPMLITLARDLGLLIDGVHLAVSIYLRATEDGPRTDADLAHRRRLLDEMEIDALQALPHRGQWNIARTPNSLIIVNTVASALPRTATEVRDSVQAVIDRFTGDRGILLAAGMGTQQSGVEGLRQSALEAGGAADSAYRGGRFGLVTVFDATGLRRILAELASSALSRRLFAEALQALDKLEPSKAARSIRTLAAYLDAECSPRRAAAALNLHPNAVSYRIRQIVDLLGVDLSVPDNRLVLHLACRTRLLDL